LNFYENSPAVPIKPVRRGGGGGGGVREGGGRRAAFHSAMN